MPKVIAMRDTVRALGLLISTSARVAPGRSLLVLLEVVGSVAEILTALWIGIIVDGIIRRQPDRIWFGLVAMVITIAAGWALSLTGAEARMTLAEKLGFAFDRRIAWLNASIPSIEHLERADYLDQLEILRSTRGLIGTGLASLLWSVNVIAMAIASITIAASIDPRLLLITVSVVPAIIATRLRNRWNARAEEESALPGRRARALSRVALTPSTGSELRAFDARATIGRWLVADLDRWRRPSVWSARRGGIATAIEESIFVIVLVAVLLWLILQLRSGTAAPAIAVAVVAARQIQWTVFGLVGQFGTMADILRNVRRMIWLDDHAATVRTDFAGSRPTPDRFDQGITLDGVGFAYHGADRPSLDGVEVQLPAGSVVAVVGENGAGKSTLVKLITGLYRPGQGRILVDGVDLTELDLDDWRRHATAAFQDHLRLELSAQYAVGFGDPDRIDDREAARRALGLAVADGVQAALPDGLDTQLGAQWRGGVDLSGGQWQKLALARAMVRDAPLLRIFDEPTAALDAQTEHELFERYIEQSREGAGRGAITVLVTHRFATVRDADLVLVLDRGRLIERGTHDELIARDGHYAELYRLQSRGYH